jgi:hypothetical protein
MSLGNGNTIRCAVEWLFDGKSQVVNTYHLGLSNITGQTQDEIRADITEYFEGLYSSITNDMAVNNVHVGIGLYNQSTNNPEIGIGASSTLDGTAGGDPLPAQDCAFLWARTALSRLIGKKYLPPFVEARWDGAKWDSTTSTHLRNMCDFLMQQYESTNGTRFLYQIWSFEHPGAHLPIEVNYALGVRIQRRRRPGVGR